LLGGDDTVLSLFNYISYILNYVSKLAYKLYYPKLTGETYHPEKLLFFNLYTPILTQTGHIRVWQLCPFIHLSVR